MKAFHVIPAQKFTLIACLLASMALAMNILHIHSRLHRHETRILEVSALWSGASHSCAVYAGDRRSQQMRKLAFLCKRCSTSYLVSDVICPPLPVQMHGMMAAHVPWSGSRSFLSARQSFHYPP